MELREVDLQGVVTQIFVIEIEDERPVVSTEPALLLEMIVSVHVGHSILRNVILDHFSDSLSHSDLHAWMQIGKTSECVAVVEWVLEIDMGLAPVFVQSISGAESKRCANRFKH